MVFVWTQAQCSLKPLQNDSTKHQAFCVSDNERHHFRESLHTRDPTTEWKRTNAMPHAAHVTEMTSESKRPGLKPHKLLCSLDDPSVRTAMCSDVFA